MRPRTTEGRTIGQLSAFVYRLSCEKAACTWFGVKLNGPEGSVMIDVQFWIAAISPAMWRTEA